MSAHDHFNAFGMVTIDADGNVIPILPADLAQLPSIETLKRAKAIIEALPVPPEAIAHHVWCLGWERRRHRYERHFRRCEPLDHTPPWVKYAKRARP